VPPLEAFHVWPNKISYVPQEVHLISGSIRRNVAIGIPEIEVDDEAVMRALGIAQLPELVTGGNSDLDNEIGAGKAILSGGQRQRLGIARALYSHPGILFMDEATSALDVNTETNISDQLKELRREITIVMIAHRLSTIQSADLIVYLDQGEIVASGSFEEVRELIPGFDKAPSIMGL
jgi:ABC-type bacteriocin/lantibiotic exporter with double-glycine peptidase domain